jgi:bifunctional UDP-N-acetylglucosamine pyrophosphorylase/glucosamine-1-phosphate N-acetyltransferase
VIVLAAGEGTRMRSALPKVLHQLAGRTMLGHVLAATEPLGAVRTAVVIGAGREQVAAGLPQGHDPAGPAGPAKGIVQGIVPVVQEQQLGTGHAVRVAVEALDAVEQLSPTAAVLVLPGDTPLLRTETLARLLALHAERHAAATLLTAVVDNPFGYGRVVREDHDGPVHAVVEERDADAVTREIDEVATGVYAFAAGHLRAALRRLTTHNAQGEQYLPDVVADLVGGGQVVQALKAGDAAETAGVNDRVQLAAAGRVLNQRLVEAAMRGGVTVIDPATTWLSAETTLEPDSTLLPGVRLEGRTTVASGAVIGPDCTLTDTEIGANARVRITTADGTIIGPGCDVGPYTYLRPGTRLGAGAKAGAYVEMKEATIGAGTKVPHLTYVGDAEVGEGGNIGCGVVFVNYDGVSKSRTVVGDAAFVGSNSLLVAPVTVGDGAYTAAGSVITEDVPAGAIAIGRSPQVNKEGWTESRRAGTRSAEAAASARQAKEQGSQG